MRRQPERVCQPCILTALTAKLGRGRTGNLRRGRGSNRVAVDVGPGESESRHLPCHPHGSVRGANRQNHSRLGARCSVVSHSPHHRWGAGAWRGRCTEEHIPASAALRGCQRPRVQPPPPGTSTPGYGRLRPTAPARHSPPSSCQPMSPCAEAQRGSQQSRVAVSLSPSVRCGRGRTSCRGAAVRSLFRWLRR